MEVRRLSNNSELYHHGILGQKWGVRRYQNKDGSLTDAGIRRYERQQKKIEAGREIGLTSNDRRKVAKNSKYLTDDELNKRAERFKNEDYIRQKQIKQYTEGQKFAIRMAEKAITIAAVAGLTYVGYKLVKRNIVNSPLYKSSLSLLENAKTKGDTVVKAGKAVGETVTNTIESSKKVVSNVSKIANNKNELRARLVAQNAIKKGYSEDVAKKIYKKVLLRG